jgi:hypothetical protein
MVEKQESFEEELLRKATMSMQRSFLRLILHFAASSSMNERMLVFSIRCRLPSVRRERRSMQTACLVDGNEHWLRCLVDTSHHRSGYQSIPNPPFARPETHAIEGLVMRIRVFNVRLMVFEVHYSWGFLCHANMKLNPEANACWHLLGYYYFV